MINTTLIKSDRGTRPDDVRQPSHDSVTARRCQVLQNSVLKDEVRVILNSRTLPAEAVKGFIMIKIQEV